MTERDGAAVHVDLGLVDAEVVDRREPDRGERLVDLEEVEALHVEVGLLRRLQDRVGGLGQQRGVGSGDLAVTDEFTERREAELLAALART